MLIYQLRKRKMVYPHETALFLNDLTNIDPATVLSDALKRYVHRPDKV